MGRNVNKVFLLGNTTETPELKYTGTGTAVTNFSIATNESYKDSSGEYVEKAQFHDITAWGKSAELICDLVVKGQQIHIEGSINYGSYENKDGITVYTTEIKLREFTLCGGRPVSAEAPAEDDAPEDDSELDTEEEPDDDLPF